MQTQATQLPSTVPDGLTRGPRSDSDWLKLLLSFVLMDMANRFNAAKCEVEDGDADSFALLLSDKVMEVLITPLELDDEYLRCLQGPLNIRIVRSNDPDHLDRPELWFSTIDPQGKTFVLGGIVHELPTPQDSNVDSQHSN